MNDIDYDAAAESAGQEYAMDLLQEEIDRLRAEVEMYRQHNDLLTHKLLTCGVAASHPDATLTLRDDYKKWDSPQAEEVRKLRAENDRLKVMLAHAGTLASITRQLVGGREFTIGAVITACPLDQVSEFVKETRKALDEYDQSVREGVK